MLRLRLGAWAALATSVAVAFAGGTAAAQPETIGADLSQAPDVNFDCTIIPYVPAAAQGGPSCTWGNPLASLSNAAAGGLSVPGNGTITQVKLRVGGSTGPMQLVVLRTLFNARDITQNSCCVATAVSSTFTPVANGITTLNVALPVGFDNSPTDQVDYLDHVGLSILEDGVTIPLVDATSVPLSDQPADEYVEPAMAVGANVLAGDPSGYTLDMQATWTPSGGAAAVVTRPHVKVAASTGPRRTLATISPLGPVDTGASEASLWAALVLHTAVARTSW